MVFALITRSRRKSQIACIHKGFTRFVLSHVAASRR
jgi:hypothetical protein